MGEITKIEWCDHTFNPWEGCQKVGPGCDHCYAETRNARYGGGVAPNWGPGAPRRRTSPANWRKPIRWNREAAAFAEAHGRKQRVFCASLADVFDNAVPLEWRRDLFGLIAATPNLDWLLLTKRIGNVGTMLVMHGLETLPVNVWLGATVVNQDEADRDIPKLLATPAAVRFLSCEPLLGPLDLKGHISEAWEGYASTWTDEHGVRRGDLTGNAIDGIDWVIVGGESGPGARPMHPDWARSLRDQCAAAGVAFHFKQWGEWVPQVGAVDGWTIPDNPEISRYDYRDWEGDHWGATYAKGWQDDLEDDTVSRIGKKHAGRLLDGVTHDGFPA